MLIDASLEGIGWVLCEMGLRRPEDAKCKSPMDLGLV